MFHTQPLKMLRQALSIPSRALRSSTRSFAQRPLSRAQTFINPTAVLRIQPAAKRWYSDAPKEAQEGQAKPEAEAEATPAPEAPKAAEPSKDPVVDELEKKLEAKDKEVAEWKVG